MIQIMSTSTGSSKYTSSSGYASSYSSRNSSVSQAAKGTRLMPPVFGKDNGRPSQDAAWWSSGEYMVPSRTTGQQKRRSGGRTGWTYHGVTGAVPEEDVWDISDSLADLYQELMKENENSLPRKRPDSVKSVDIKSWLGQDTNNGFIRVYVPDTDFHKAYLIPCTLNTPSHQICLTLGIPPNSLHIQLNGDKIRRLDPYENPLVIQNEYLATLGFSDLSRIQQEGTSTDLGYLIRFYTGKPFQDGTYSRNQLTAYCNVRRGKVLNQWNKRLCSISGTRLFLFKGRDRTSTPTIVQLVKGSVEDSPQKGHDFCLKLTSTFHGEKVFYLSFNSESEFMKWRRKCKKATSKLPTTADLSSCHLEFLPETIFINEDLIMLNLRHNVLKERPIEEDIYTIGWLDDLPRFTSLRSLNLADNDLTCIPLAICNIKTLAELNVASNLITMVPSQISNLTNLQAFHIHNNRLESLPDEMVTLKNLFILVLAFNRFTTIPSVVTSLSNVRIGSIENIIMAGNRVTSLPSDLLSRLKHTKKMDLRMNELSLPPSEMMKLNLLEQLTHMDIRDNRVSDLDIRGLGSLEYINCERCGCQTLQINGQALKNVFAANNEIQVLSIQPKPEYLSILDLNRNKLKSLPRWIVDCFFLQRLYVSHNKLSNLPERLFSDAKKLKYLWLDHNSLDGLPEACEPFAIEECHLEYNKIKQLPQDFFICANRLKVFNATSNRLTTLPPLNATEDLNKVQELSLTSNFLQDSVFPIISRFSRLKILHLAHNDIYEINEREISRLEMLQELNISGNKLKFLPNCLPRLPELRILRAHSNLLRDLPDFNGTSLKVLDVGCNRLLGASVTDLMASQIDLLDMSCNTQMKVSENDMRTMSRIKDICLVDMTGQNRILPGLDQPTGFKKHHVVPWTVGFSETSGNRNKLCVSIFKDVSFGSDDQALFAIFDGGHNNQVPNQLVECLPNILRKEEKNSKTSDQYIKYTILACHRQLKSNSHRLGASAAVCHIKKVYMEGSEKYIMEVADVGDVEIVISRAGEAVCMTEMHTLDENKQERIRICKNGGIITEDNKVNGTSATTRQLGCSYLYPHIVPDPHITRTTLGSRDQLLIIANRGLWKYVTYQEAVWEVQGITNPVLAAKRLQDVAQSYGSKENISIIVIKLNISADDNLNRDSVGSQYDIQDALGSLQNVLPGDEDKDDDEAFCDSDTDTITHSPPNSHSDKDIPDNASEQNTERSEEIQIRPLPRQRFRKKNAGSEWEEILQRRLSEELKDKELKTASLDIDIITEFGGRKPKVSDNWTQCIGRRQGIEIANKMSGNNKPITRKITLPSWMMPQTLPQEAPDDESEGNDHSSDNEIGIHVNIVEEKPNKLNISSQDVTSSDTGSDATLCSRDYQRDLPSEKVLIIENSTEKAEVTKPHHRVVDTSCPAHGQHVHAMEKFEITDKAEIEKMLSSSSLGSLYSAESVQSVIVTSL